MITTCCVVRQFISWKLTVTPPGENARTFEIQDAINHTIEEKTGGGAVRQRKIFLDSGIEIDTNVKEENARRFYRLDYHKTGFRHFLVEDVAWRDGTGDGLTPVDISREAVEKTWKTGRHRDFTIAHFSEKNISRRYGTPDEGCLRKWVDTPFLQVDPGEEGDARFRIVVVIRSRCGGPRRTMKLWVKLHGTGRNIGADRIVYSKKRNEVTKRRKGGWLDR